MPLDSEKLSCSDIKSLVLNKTKAGAKLDFQSSGYLVPGDDKKELWLSKYISSFANSVGGTVIFGVKTFRGKAFELADFDLSQTSAFWLRTLLENTISPVIHKLEVYEIPASNENDKTGFIVVNIPKSTMRPHMAADNRYYHRIKLQPEMMDESRVRELYNMAAVPEMEFVGITNTNGVPTLENGLFSTLSFYPKFLVRNAGSAIEKHFKFELWLPSALCDTLFSPLQNYFNRIEGVFSVFSVPNRQPVFQDEICNVLEAKLFVNLENIQQFMKGEMIIKLYHSKGLKEFRYLLSETFIYENRIISSADFIKLPQHKIN